MADYTTRTLAEKLLPARTEENPKAATRELRKFLRDTLGEGKAVVGKGNRYALSYNAKELTALKRKFATWQVEQAEAQQARRDALAARVTPTTHPSAIIDEAPIKGAEDEMINAAINAAEENENISNDGIVEGPSDEEIAAMLSDDEETPDEA